MVMKKNITFLLFFLLFASSCKKVDADYAKQLSKADFLHQSMKNLTDIIVHDIFSPPVASRIYAYPSIAAYEIFAQSDNSINSLAGKIKDLKPIPKAKKDILPSIAAVQAFNLVGKQLIFSEDKMEAFQETLLNQFKKINAPSGLLDNSIEYGQKVANHILAWADKDNYKQTRSFPKYTVTDDEDSWRPTPPAYMDGIEPHWKEIRPFVIESADQFTPEPPTKFDLKKGSDFYKEVEEVYLVGKNIKEEEKLIASFWDCNPYVMNLTGHAMFATKKITPGGHWIGITRIACEKDKASISKSAKAYALCSIALMDAFISCWDEKYRSKLIRPETIINEHIDADWLPILQTPPFPEYTSGHSVISTASAIMLSSIFGENFSYIDDVEVEYGLPTRSFGSFMEASQEAAISRLYGGIHYRPAIDNGVKQGEKLGRYLVEKLN